MNKSEAQQKLALLPLVTVVTTEDGINQNDEPCLEFTYDSVPGPGTVVIQLPLTPTATHLSDLAHNLPILPQHQLASLAILLAPLPVVPLPT